MPFRSVPGRGRVLASEPVARMRWEKGMAPPDESETIESLRSMAETDCTPRKL